jgi:hypothetical protein
MDETPEEKAQREADEAAAAAIAATGGGALGTVASPAEREAAGRFAGNVGDVIRNLPYGGVLTDVLGLDRKSATSAATPVTTPVTTPAAEPVAPTTPTLTGNENEAQLGYTQLGELPKPVAAPVPETDEQKLRKLWAQFGGGVGAPAVKMNEYLKQGYGQQREANQDMLPALTAEDETKALARQGIQAEGKNYVEGLKKLQDKQSALFDQRRGQMAEDERKLAAAENTFDASRVLRKLGDNPVSTAAMSFAAGLVGALKGAAGDMSANQVLAEVDKAVERDVMNQKEQYSRMLQGQTTARSNFHDARQMGADDQTALATASLASMDQHKRALEFAEARITDASKKAALKGAIGTINVEQGKMQYQMDVHNQAASLSASKANRDFKMQLMQNIRQQGMMDPKLVEQATKEYQSMALNPRFEATRAKSSAVGEASGLLSEFSKKEIEHAFNPSMVKSLRTVMDKAAAAAGGKGGGVVSGAVTQYLNDQSHASQEPKERKLLAALSKITNADMLKLYGSTVNMGDDTRYAATKTFDSADNFLSWMESVEKDALEDQRGLIITGKNNPALGSMLTDLFAPSAFQIDQRRKGNAATAAANAAVEKGPAK